MPRIRVSLDLGETSICDKLKSYIRTSDPVIMADEIEWENGKPYPCTQVTTTYEDLVFLNELPGFRVFGIQADGKWVIPIRVPRSVLTKLE